MTAGLAYSPADPDLTAARRLAERMVRDFNATAAGDEGARTAILPRMLGTWNGAVIRPPFRVEYGMNVHFDEACFVNEGCTIVDVCPVRIGAFTLIAPGVQILTVDPEAPEGTAGKPVAIGRNVWVGAGAVIHPGVTIGDDVIVGAGAVVTTDVPTAATVTGNPARIIG